MGRVAKKRKIRNLLINVSVQMKIIIYNVVFMCVAVMLTIVMVYNYSFNRFSPTGISPWELYVVLFLTSVLYIFCQLWVTHQFCGAMVNFVNSFKASAKGDLTRKVHLRKDDLLKNEATEFNVMIDNLSSYILVVKQDQRLILSMLKDLVEGKADPETAEKIRKMMDEKEKLFIENLDKLKLQNE